MFNKILICLDGSHLAEQILPHALAQAKIFNSTILLLKVIGSYITIPPGGLGYSLPFLNTTGQANDDEKVKAYRTLTETELLEIEKEYNEADDYLKNIASHVGNEEFKTEIATIQGQAGEAIVNYAKNNNIDLIALATHGRGGLERTVFGSVADYVIHETKLPTLLVKPRDIEKQKYGAVQIPKKIFVCLDGSDLAEQALPYAQQLALGFSSKLLLFQAIDDPIIVSPVIPGGNVVPIWTPRMEESALRKNDESMSYLNLLAQKIKSERDIRVDCITAFGPAGLAIEQYTSGNYIDLITMATHGRSGLGRAIFGSVADYVLRNTDSPLLLIKPQTI